MDYSKLSRGKENRIERAKRWLLKGKSVGYVAKKVGYSGHSSFCISFKRTVGKSPTQFIKENMKK